MCTTAFRLWPRSQASCLRRIGNATTSQLLEKCVSIQPAAGSASRALDCVFSLKDCNGRLPSTQNNAAPVPSAGNIQKYYVVLYHSRCCTVCRLPDIAASSAVAAQTYRAAVRAVVQQAVCAMFTYACSASMCGSLAQHQLEPQCSTVQLLKKLCCSILATTAACMMC
jgi:hypothetical protein